MSDIRRADLHVHSTASHVSKLGVARSLQLPECATEPQEVYELAKSRGMDFVTITDHDTIDGALELAHLPDTFVSEELTVSFKDEPQAVHLLCYGITPEDHEWLQAHSDDLEACAEYVHGNGITAAVAHPFYAVRAPLGARHRRRLAELFPIWETRNGSRAKELNLPAFVYIETHGGIAIGGSDDHAGIDVGRTFTETPAAATPEEFLDHVRAGRAEARGAQGSAAKWAHAALALAVRALGDDVDLSGADPVAALKIVQRLMHEGDARQGTERADIGPNDARRLLSAWVDGMSLELGVGGFLVALQEGDIDHPDLYRRARRIHERKLRGVARRVAESVQSSPAPDPGAAIVEAFDACLPVIPYVASIAFLGREKTKLSRNEGDPRVALLTDGIGAMHGVAHAIQQIRERGVPGFDVEVIGTDAEVDRRLAAVADLQAPFYRDQQIGIPALQAVVETVADGRYDLVHVCAPGPAGVAGNLIARLLELPVVASYHTDLVTYARLRTGRPELEAMMRLMLAKFYCSADTVLSPSPASDLRLAELGVRGERIGRWERGVDLALFDPALRTEGLLPGQINVLYAGRLSREKGVDLLADSFLRAHNRDPRLHLVLAGGGPEEDKLRATLGSRATFLGWVEREPLARVYASADAFVFPSATDTFGQVVLEAQASGLPVLAVNEGGPASIIRHGETGVLVPADPQALAHALLWLLGKPRLIAQIRAAALDAVRARTWDAAFVQLAEGYGRALSTGAELARAA